MSKMNVPLYRHNLYNENTAELGDRIATILSTMQISTGEVNKLVSELFANYTNRKHCLLTANWTTGMIATLIAIGVKPGDEVIVPALTFAASANVVETLGARAVFVDVDVDTKLMDIQATLDAVTDRTVAVMPVHLYGQMIDVKKLRFFLPSHIKIIEDAAHAIEADFIGDRPGTYSDAAIFSFYQSKNMTTGEGGAIVTDNVDLYNKIRVTYRHGIDLCGYQRHIAEKFIPPDGISLGIKANMPDILASLLPVQIDKAEQNLLRREQIAQTYFNELDHLDIEFPYQVTNTKHARHIFPIGLLPKIRNSVLAELNERGIKSTIHFKSLHTNSYYKDKYNYRDEDFPCSYIWGEKVISLPIFPGLTELEQEYVIENLKDILK